MTDVLEKCAIKLFEDETGHKGRWEEFDDKVKPKYREKARACIQAFLDDVVPRIEADFAEFASFVPQRSITEILGKHLQLME